MMSTLEDINDRSFSQLDDTRLIMTAFAHQLPSCVFLKQTIN